jgi:hypothetical protein
MATGRGRPGREVVRIGPNPYATVTGAPVQPRGQVPYPTPIQQGDPTQVTNNLVAAETVTTQVGGMAADSYTESGGETPLTAHTVSDAMTLYGPVTCRHLPTLLTTLPGSPLTGRWHAEYVGLTNCTWLLWKWGAGDVWRWSQASGLVDMTTAIPDAPFSKATSFCRMNGYLIFGVDTGTIPSAGFRYSTDGVTWLSGGGVAGYAIGRGMAVHDNKLYTLASTSAPPNATWLTVIAAPDPNGWAAAKVIGNIENAAFAGGPHQGIELKEWRDGEGNRALWAVTNQALYILDDSNGIFQKVRSLAGYASASPTLTPQLCVWESDDNAYLTLYDPSGDGGRDQVIQFTGGSRLNVGPTRPGRYGLRDADKFRFSHLVGGADSFLVGFGQEKSGTANTGRAVALRGDGWHTLLRDTTAATKVRGGGWGNGLLVTIMSNGAVFQTDLADDLTPPQYASGRSYDTATVTHELAWFTGGVPLLSKIVLDVTTMCVYDNGTIKDAPGLPTGATLEYQYRLDGGGIVSLGTITSAQTAWPVVLAFSSPALYKKGKLYEVLTRGAATTATPIRTAVSWHWQRRERQKFDYTVRVDLNYRGGGREWLGRTAAQQRAELLALANPNTAAGQTGVTAFSYGGGPDGTGPNATTVAQARVEVASVEDPVTGRGEMLVVLRDITADPSG